MFGRLSPRRRRAAPSADGAEPQAPAHDLPASPEASDQPTVVQPAVASAAIPRTGDGVALPPAAILPPGEGAVVAGTHSIPPAADGAVVADTPATPEADDDAVVLPPPDHAVPAGTELAPAADAGDPVPSFRTRGRLRRRLRYLRRVRELAFRDLGGLTFDLHRFGRDGRSLVAGKLEALAAVDTELRALERAMDDRRDHVELREPGIAACPRCAALHGSDARFCPSCGLHLAGRWVPGGGDGALAAEPVGPTAVPAPAASAAPAAWSTAPAAPAPEAQPTTSAPIVPAGAEGEGATTGPAPAP